MKKNLFILLFSGFHLCASAQTFLHGAGTGASVFTARDIETSVYGTLLYSPRVTVTENEQFSVSIGIPVTIGFTGGIGYNSSLGTYDDFKFLIYTPAMLNYNWGAGSSPLSERRFGFFAGAGFGITFGNHYMDSWEYSWYEEKTRAYWGPAANAGVRFGVGKQSKNIEVLMSYKKGLSANNPQYFGLSCLFNFR